MIGIGIGIGIGFPSGPDVRTAGQAVLLTASPSVQRSITRANSVLVTGTPAVVAAQIQPAASWDADYGVSVTVAAVNSWTDQKNGYVLTPGNANKPTLSTAKFGGLNSILFTRALTHFLTNTTTPALYQLANGNDPSLTVVWQSINVTVPAEEEVWFFGREGGSSADRLTASPITTTTMRLFDNGETGGANILFTVADMTAADHVYALVFSGTTQTLYVDGVANGTVGAIDAAARTTTTRFNIGGYSSSGTGAFDGYIRRLDIYSAALSPAQIAEISTAWSGA